MDLLYRVRCGQIATVEIGPLPGLAVELLNSIGRGLPIGAFALWRLAGGSVANHKKRSPSGRSSYTVGI
jgi:hypothetical protein